MKKCPYCAEDIQNAAKKCRYCGEWLSKKTNISQIKSFVKSAKKLNKIKSSKELPMKWYWFTIYITWPLSIIISLLSIATAKGFGLDITGYLYLALLQILLISVSCYGLYKKYDWSWELYIGIIAINSLINGFVGSDNSPIGFLVISTLLFSLYVYPQYVYFKKRKHLFTNSISVDKPKKKKLKKNVKKEQKKSNSKSAFYSIIGVLLIGFLLFLANQGSRSSAGVPNINLDDLLNKYASNEHFIKQDNENYIKISDAHVYQYFNNKEFYVGKIKDGKNHGKWTYWYDNGQKEEIYNFKNGLAHGPSFSWHKNGQKRTISAYKNGLAHGSWTDWYKNGQKQTEGKYANDLQNGRWTYWYENGQIDNVSFFKNDMLDGLDTYWYENGQKAHELNYKNGESDGIENFWDENGQKLDEGYYKNGKKDGLFKSWHDNGQTKSFTLYEVDTLISRKCWNEDGNVIKCKTK